MSIKLKAAKVGDFIIDECGYIYKVKNVYDKYVRVEENFFIMHQDYNVLHNSEIRDINFLSGVLDLFYSKNDYSFSDEILNKFLTRMMYRYEENKEPEHIFTFEDYEELKTDDIYEYDIS
jgi:hypothetical protein